MTVSIHAPWEGCDSAVATLIVVFFVFQFTHPGKGATTRTVGRTLINTTFQFTHPGKGATLGA